jgi:D-2-hydroxyacid dehydrogenase (NADP+)
MRVIATRRDPSKGAGAADKIVGGDGLLDVLPQADFVALTHPLPALRLGDARSQPD